MKVGVLWPSVAPPAPRASTWPCQPQASFLNSLTLPGGFLQRAGTARKMEDKGVVGRVAGDPQSQNCTSAYTPLEALAHSCLPRQTARPPSSRSGSPCCHCIPGAQNSA